MAFRVAMLLTLIFVLYSSVTRATAQNTANDTTATTAPSMSNTTYNGTEITTASITAVTSNSTLNISTIAMDNNTASYTTEIYSNTSTSTPSTTMTTTTGPPCQCGSSFDAGSFVGGMAVVLVMFVVGFILVKYCRYRRGRTQTNYATF